MLRSILDTLNTALAKGDIDTVRDTLQADADAVKEMLPKIINEKSREFCAKLIKTIGELIENLASNKANIQDVRTFANDLRKKLRQRLIDRFKENSS